MTPNPKPPEAPWPLAAGVAAIAAVIALVVALSLASRSNAAPRLHPAPPALTNVSTAKAADRPSAAGAPREIKWDDLVPKDWDPMQGLQQPRRLGGMSDSDPATQDMYRQLRLAWNNAPTVTALDGQSVKLAGYVVPLDEVKGELREFLLVPYFGACIHTPPPPANQIVLVQPKGGVKGFKAMDTVWVSGTMRATRFDSAMGTSGYRLEAATVEKYVAPAAR